MARKYAKDYRAVTRLNAAGRRETALVYEGAYYNLSCSAAERKGLRLRCLVLSVLADLCLAALLVFSNRFHPDFRFLVLPSALGVLPAGLVLNCVSALLFARAPYERRIRDKLCSTLPAASLALAILAGLSVAAQLAQPLLHGWSTASALLLVCALCYAAAAWGLFLQRGKLKAEEVPAP